MALLELKGITAGYGQNVILRDFNLNVERGEFVSLLGSSGCGKTTTLRVIAGFVTPKSGNVFFDGKDIANMPPYKRPVNTSTLPVTRPEMLSGKTTWKNAPSFVAPRLPAASLRSSGM